MAGGCGPIDAMSDEIHAAATITMDDEIPPVQVVEVIDLDGVRQLPACMDGSKVLETGARVSMRTGPSGCSLSLWRPNVTLLDKRASKRIKASAGILHVDSVRSGSLTLEEIEIRTSDGGYVELREEALWVTALLDGRRMLDRVPSTNVREGLAWRLPGRVVDKIARAVDAERAVVVEFELLLALRDSALVDFPSWLWLSVILDPAFEVDLFDAAL